MGWSEKGDNFQIAGRTAQISLIRECLATLWQERSRTASALLLHFYGMRGIGKTRLLKAVEAEMLAKPPGSDLVTLFLKAPAPFKLANQNEITQYRPLDEIEAFFNEFHLQFKQVAGSLYELTDYERLLANRRQLKDEEGLWLRAKTLASDLLRLHRDQQLRLLILEDGVPPKLFQWLGKFFYKDLLAEGALCVVATGYAAPVVSTLSLVQYFKSQPLLPLLPEEARQALSPYNFSFALENQLVELAAGHPGSLLQGAEEVEALQQQQRKLFEENGELNLAGRAQVVNAMAATLLHDISPALARCCRLIAPLRSFRYDTLAALLPTLMPEDPRYGRANVVDYMLLGKDLNDQVDFIDSDKTYVMHPVARAILSNALKYTDLPAGLRYRQVNEVAARYYAGLIDRLEKPEQRSDAALEELYHHLLLARFEVELDKRPVSAALNQVAELLQRRLHSLGGLEGNHRLINLLEGDSDFRRLFPAEIDGLLQMLYESRAR